MNRYKDILTTKKDHLEEEKNISVDERVEELADVLEVLCAIGALEGKDLDSIIFVMKSKREKRGGFSQKIFLEKTTK